MILFTLLITSNPGYIPQNKHITLLVSICLNIQELVEKRIKINTFCPICIIHKENSTKHCFYCNRCVIEFDHHCFWVNNCIGSSNIYKFYSFVIMTYINLLFMTYIGIYGIFSNDEINRNFFYFSALESLYRYRKMYCCLLITITVMFIIPVSLLLYFNLNNGIKKLKTRKSTRSNITDEEKRLLEEV
jgi:palmitoyltransferase ZDHHC9/14/18